MGTVTSLDEHRLLRLGPQEAVGRLERAVQRLDPAIRRSGSALTPTLERELVGIARAVTRGSHVEAAARAERLLGLLAHPAMSG